MQFTNIEPTGQAGPSSLATLAERINGERLAAEQAAESAIEHAIRCGELLMEAKALVQHGEWGAWLAANYQRSARSAQSYMQLANELPPYLKGNPQSTADLTIAGALKLLASPKEPIELDTEVRPSDDLIELDDLLAADKASDESLAEESGIDEPGIKPWEQPNSDFGFPNDLDDRPHRGILAENGTLVVAMELVPSKRFPGYIYAAILTKFNVMYYSRPLRSTSFGWLLAFLIKEDCDVDVKTLIWDELAFERSVLFDIWFEKHFDPATATPYERTMVVDLGYTA